MATEVKHSSGIRFEKAKCMGKTDDNREIECTTTAAMVIINGDAYVLKYLYDKDNHNPNPSTAILYLVKDISGSQTHSKLQIYKTVSKVHKYVFFKHLNSITYHDSKFYLVDLEEKIYRLSSKGRIERGYTVKNSLFADKFQLATIEHYKDNLYILGVLKNKDTHTRKYWIIEFDAKQNNNLVIRGSFICGECEQDGWVGNDICYDAGTQLFYITMSYKDKAKKICIENKIFTYNLSTLDPYAHSTAVYQPTRVLYEVLDSKTKTEKSFEYEGISIFNDRKYIAMERTLESGKSGYQDDAIVMLSAVKN